ncbi:MAG: hypothetical protein K2Y08_05710 [Alphaproteobacteria bacterium]|nr:hypothetical protein [Alphaproteobacteria bacterium]
MKLFLNTLLLLASMLPLKANQYCECISTIISPAPNNKLMYTANCFVDGKKKAELLESTIVDNQAEADKATASFMQTYNIKEGDCVKRPDGSMVRVHQNKNKTSTNKP